MYAKKLMELLKEGYKAKVVSPFGILFSVSADTSEILEQKLGDKLSELTMEDGVVFQKGTLIQKQLVNKFMGVVVNRKQIGVKQIA